MKISKKSIIIAWLLLAAILAGCSKKTAIPNPFEITGTPPAVDDSLAYPVASGQFENSDCPFRSPGGTGNDENGVKIQCGLLSVPEDRSQPDGVKIKLPVAIYKSPAAKTRKDPVLALYSSPSSVFQRSYYLMRLFQQLSPDRDIIVMEQRGAGASQPSIDCPDVPRPATDMLAVGPYSRAMIDSLLQVQQTCHDSALQKGIHLEFYTTEASAADIEDLRAALGIDQWNIVSAGYGSRLAAILMRDYPQSIRSVVMDSPLPPQGNLYLDQAMSAQQALAEFFKSCASDPACSQAYPDLENNFYNLVYALNTSPLSVPVSDLSAGKRYDILLDGDRLLDITLNAIRSERMQVLSVLPRIVFQLQNGKTQQVAETLGSMSNSLIQAAAGLNLLVSCRDQFNQATPDQIQQANSQAAPQLGDYFNHQLEYLQAACEIWKTNAPAEKMAPVLSSIPVLVLSGSYGWSTPPAWAKQVAGGLSRSTLVEFAGGGQTVTTSQRWSDCAGKIGSAFLSDPQARPDTGCSQEKKPVEWITVP